MVTGQSFDAERLLKSGRGCEAAKHPSSRLYLINPQWQKRTWSPEWPHNRANGEIEMITGEEAEWRWYFMGQLSHHLLKVIPSGSVGNHCKPKELRMAESQRKSE
jgi:hypothetical protein